MLTRYNLNSVNKDFNKINIISSLIGNSMKTKNKKMAHFNRRINTINHNTSEYEKHSEYQIQPEYQKHRYNEIGIQMLSDNFFSKIFKTNSTTEIKERKNDEKKKKIIQIRNHLKRYSLLDKNPDLLEEVDFELPQLTGSNINDHFERIAQDQVEEKLKNIEILLTSTVPVKPKEWLFKRGWTKYDQLSKKCYNVECPEEGIVVFDVEVLMKIGNFPVLAVALSPTAWYSWCSDILFAAEFEPNLTLKYLVPFKKESLIKNLDPNKKENLDSNKKENLDPNKKENLDPNKKENLDLDKKENLDPNKKENLELDKKENLDLDEKENLDLDKKENHDLDKECLIIGHNVGYDRSFIREEYNIKKIKLKYLDTMSLHICTSGLTSFQRMLIMAKRAGSKRKEFVDREKESFKRGRLPNFEWAKYGSMNSLNDVYQFHCKARRLEKEVRNVFVDGDLDDVKKDFQRLMDYCSSDVLATYKVFKEIWPRFRERFPHPVTLAGMFKMGESYLPLNDNDSWTTYIERSQEKYNEMQREISEKLNKLAIEALRLMNNNKYKKDLWLWDLDWTPKKFKNKESNFLKNSKIEIDVNEYPKWFVELCSKDDSGNLLLNKLTLQKRSASKLLCLTWNGFPLHYSPEHGWGYLVPRTCNNQLDVELMRQESVLDPNGNNDTIVDHGRVFPFESFVDYCQLHKLGSTKKSVKKVLRDEPSYTDEEVSLMSDEIVVASHLYKEKKKLSSHKDDDEANGPFDDVIPECNFYKLPHKDGCQKKVGNPLSKDFIDKIKRGVLNSARQEEIEIVLKCSNLSSYWKNNLKRIKSQIVISSEKSITAIRSEEKDVEIGSEKNGGYGTIIPRIVTAGTVTRRAVEPTWLTASNANEERIGSELKCMIQAPDGYHFVGADVDSQELWIASLLGDSNFAGIHGCTAFGWMTLQGNKQDGTDMHSKTASIINISREQAKIFNYSRIYGAGQRFAEQMLMQFDSKLNKNDAQKKAKLMYQATKGRRVSIGPMEGDEDFIEDIHSTQWEGGSESHMFNMLESIAQSRHPKTPVLKACISEALEPKVVNNEFLTSRINWVVQSSAVDFLHLLLVCMQWIIDTYKIDARFCISIHDEVRYLVSSEDRYKAALALQISNLLTRSLFAYRLGFGDLPQSVAFFSSIEIDKCLRKEVDNDCITPSNQEGLLLNYGIPKGESLNIYDIIEKTNGKMN